MDAVLCPAKAAEEALSLVRAGLTVAVAFLVIDPLRQEAIMQRIPSAGFVGMDRRAGRDALADHGNGGAFRLEDEGQREAVALAHDDHDLALAGLVLSKPAINPVVLVVGLADVPADISAVHFDFAV